MTRQEFRAAGSLAAVFSVRLLGLFMIYPVFAAYARDLSGATPYLIGEARHAISRSGYVLDVQLKRLPEDGA